MDEPLITPRPKYAFSQIFIMVIIFCLGFSISQAGSKDLLTTKNMLQTEFTLVRVAAMTLYSMVIWKMKGIDARCVPKSLHRKMAMCCITQITCQLGIIVGI